MCCSSLRGVAYFGASVHVTLGVVLFGRYVVASLIFTFLNFNNFVSEKVTAFLAPFMVYVTLLLALGILIFYSIEREYFLILKWSSVAFSLLQLLVFASILVLKLTPAFSYAQFPFLPPSLRTLYSPSPPPHPHSGHEVILAVPHGTTLEEKDLIFTNLNKPPHSTSSSPEPPDPGGGGVSSPATPSTPLLFPPNFSNNQSHSRSVVSEESRLTGEVLRVGFLVLWVLLTLLYLSSLFLYIRRLNTGHVFGHAAQALSTRALAFYVQPQYTVPRGDQTDNNRSNTLIPSNFLPQDNKLATPTTRSPKRQPQPQQPSSQLSNHHQSPKRNPTLTTTCDSSSSTLLNPHPHQQHMQPLPILGPAASTPQMRGPIPAQVRIGFYPSDLVGGAGPGGGGALHPQQQQQQPPQLQQQPPQLQQHPTAYINESGELVVSHQSAIRGPPPPLPGGPGPHPQGQHYIQRSGPVPHHLHPQYRYPPSSPQLQQQQQQPPPWYRGSPRPQYAHYAQSSPADFHPHHSPQPHPGPAPRHYLHPHHPISMV